MRYPWCVFVAWGEEIVEVVTTTFPCFNGALQTVSTVPPHVERVLCWVKVSSVSPLFIWLSNCKGFSLAFLQLSSLAFCSQWNINFRQRSCFRFSWVFYRALFQRNLDFSRFQNSETVFTVWATYVLSFLFNDQGVFPLFFSMLFFPFLSQWKILFLWPIVHRHLATLTSVWSRIIFHAFS